MEQEDWTGTMEYRTYDFNVSFVEEKNERRLFASEVKPMINPTNMIHK